MKTYKAKQYAKILPDGSIDIITSVLKTPTRTYYYPGDAVCAAYGYYPIDVIGDDTEEEGYKIFDDGTKVVEKDGKKVVQRIVRKLEIVDEGPKPGPGQEVKSDKWKEIKGKWVHVYKYRSASRHVTPTKFPDDPVPSKKDEEPVVEAAPEEVAPTPEPVPVPLAAEEPKVEEVAETKDPVDPIEGTSSTMTPGSPDDIDNLPVGECNCGDHCNHEQPSEENN